MLYLEPYDSFYFISRFMAFTSLALIVLLTLSVGVAYFSGAINQSYLYMSAFIALLVAVVGVAFYLLPRNRLSLIERDGELLVLSGSDQVCKLPECDVRIICNQVRVELFPTYKRGTTQAQKVIKRNYAVWLCIQTQSGFSRACLLALEPDTEFADQAVERWVSAIGVAQQVDEPTTGALPQQIHLTYRKCDFQLSKGTNNGQS